MRPTCSSSSAADKDLESDFQIYVTLPVLGRSDVPKQWSFGQRAERVGACCARGRAHSGPVVIGGTRKLRLRPSPDTRKKLSWKPFSLNGYADNVANHYELHTPQLPQDSRPWRRRIQF